MVIRDLFFELGAKETPILLTVAIVILIYYLKLINIFMNVQMTVQCVSNLQGSQQQRGIFKG